MNTYRVFVNGKEVNSFGSVDAAYDFALAIERGELPLEEYNGSQSVTFETHDGKMTTAQYSIED